MRFDPVYEKTRRFLEHREHFVLIFGSHSQLRALTEVYGRADS